MPANKTYPTAVIILTKFWLPVFACMAVIFIFSSYPAQDTPELFPLQDVLYHGIIYALLAYLFARALKNTHTRITPLKLILYTLVFGIGYGSSDEFHQLGVAGRTASWFDLFIDAVGTFIGGAIYKWNDTDTAI